VTVALTWRGPVANTELNALHAEGFGHSLLGEDWEGQLARHSLGWVAARDADRLVGFGNVAGDGALMPSCWTRSSRSTTDGAASGRLSCRAR
jgi:hypothetical protein